MKDFLFNLIVITAVADNMSNREICALATTTISQLKILREDGRIEIHIIGKSIYNDALQKKIALFISLNHDLKHLDIKILQNKIPETSIECAEHLIKNIPWIYVYRLYIISLRREFTKTRLIWYYTQKEIHTKRRKLSIEVLTTGDKTPSKNKIHEFIETIKATLHFSIGTPTTKQRYKNNTDQKNEDFSAIDDLRLDTIKRTHKNL